MVRLIIFIFLIYILYRLVKKTFGIGPKISGRESSSGVISEMVQDPICKTYIPRKEAYREKVRGEEILFCSKECAERYKENI